MREIKAAVLSLPPSVIRASFPRYELESNEPRNARDAGIGLSIAILVCSLSMAVGHLDLDARRANSFRMTASNLALVVGSVLSLQALILEAPRNSEVL